MDSPTPGPWFQSHREQHDGMYITQVYDASGQTIADLAWYAVEDGRWTRTTREANARLIAAAPDLLAAGQAVLASIDAGTLMQPRGGVVRDVAAVSRLRAAIAKAEGQP